MDSAPSSSTLSSEEDDTASSPSLPSANDDSYVIDTPQELTDYLSGSTITILGFGFAAYFLAYILPQSSVTSNTEYNTAANMAIFPLLVALFLCGTGLWVADREWPTVSPWRLVSWVFGGVSVGLLIGASLIWHQSTAGGVIAAPGFMLITVTTYAAGCGALIGSYDTRTREAQRQLEHTVRQHNEVVSIVTHDVRNPLQSAQGYLNLLKEDTDSEYLDKIDASLARIDHIVSESLGIVSRDLDTLSFDVFALGGLVQEVWDELDVTTNGDFRVQVEEATLEIETEQRIRADREWTTQLIENLLRNAIGHNSSPVTITIGDLEDKDGFYVADDGDGVPDHLRDRVFESGYTTAQKGTGVGLAIVRAVADAHNWTVRITDSESGGAQVEIYDRS